MPAPEAAWYVLTMSLFRPALCASGHVGTRPMIVAQLGFAMMFLGWFAMSSGLISGMTRGTSASSLNAWELSTHTAPRAAASGRSSLAWASPAAPSTMSTPSNASGVASSTVTSSPLNLTVFPAERALASGTSRSTGKSLSSRHWIIWVPTTPVAPRIATTNLSAMSISSLFSHGEKRRCSGSEPRAGPSPRCLVLLVQAHVLRLHEVVVDDLDRAGEV